MIRVGDCLEVMRTLEANSVDAVVTDPPYGIRFMGKAWDGADIEKRHAQNARKETVRSDGYARTDGPAFAAGSYDLSPVGMRAFQEFSRLWAIEAMRVMKPGGHLVSFASPRTYHRMVCGIEEAGFEIRDSLMWLFGSGFPKSHNLAGEWQGWGTALKPGYEPIVLARKPLAGTVAANVLAHGTGALNIDRCRIETEEVNPSIARRQGSTNHLSKRSAAESEADGKMESRQSPQAYSRPREGDTLGRWPANVLHDGSDEVVALFPQSDGQAGAVLGTESSKTGEGACYGEYGRVPFPVRGDSGSAARFFYCAKASREDRNDGLLDPGPQFKANRTPRDAEKLEAAKRGNHHPTVKPTDLMRWLCRLVTPPGGLVLDPFTGSGSTGRAAIAEGMRFVGIELDPAYAEIAEARCRVVQPGLTFGAAA